MTRPRRHEGGMGDGVLATLFRYEIKMLLRDRRTVLVSVVIPLVIWPVMIFVMSWTEDRETERLEATTLTYAVAGSEAELARGLVSEALARAREADTAEVRVELREERVEDPYALLQAGDLQLVVQGMTYREWVRVRDSLRQAADTLGEGEESERRADEPRAPIPVMRLHYRDNSDFSSTAMRRARDALRELRAERRETLFLERGFPVEPDSVAAVDLQNVATAEEEAGAVLGVMLTPFIVLLMLTGGSIVAVDAISGEKERGTLETLLTTAARRGEIVAAKQGAIVVVGLAIAVINVVNLLVYLALGLFELPEALSALSVTPLGAVILLVLFLPLALLISSVLLLLSGYSKSYKEYQIYFFPVVLLVVLPSLAAVLPGMDLRSVVAVAPVAGVSVATRQVLTGQYDWLFLALCFVSTGAFAAWLAGITINTLSTERLITEAELDRADLEGGPALFPKHVLRWFALMWAVLLVVSNWFGADLGLNGQVLVNLLGIFLGGSLLMLWRYRLDPGKALALRLPRPAAWVAVLIGAPAGLLTGQGVFQLANFVFPVPQRMLESFGQYLAPETLPLWQLVLLLCVLPGVVEEIAFRGVLLHGLRRRLGPVGLCLATGAIFGLFHVSLFRLLPTAWLGVVLAAVVLLTGSLFPAMLWHTLNNASALVPERLGWLPEGFEPAWWWALVGLAGLAVSFWILWASRTPYPDLRAPGNVDRTASVAERGRIGSAVR